jgi:hypothetical protein
MDRNSPVSLWGALCVGVGVLVVLYLFGQSQLSMSGTQLGANAPSISPTASLSPLLASISAVPSATSQAIASASDSYSGIVEIGTADHLNIPGKYQCGAYSVTRPSVNQQPYDHRIAYPSDIFLRPSGKLLLHLTEPPGYGPQYDVTFSKNCEHLYYFDTHAHDNQIRTLDVSSGEQSMLTIPISSFPPALVLSPSISPYYPSLQFIYAIDDNHLLLWFYNPVTGPDYGVNDTSQAVYDIPAKTLTFLSKGEMDPTSMAKSGVALLNYKTNTLIVMGAANTQGFVTTRTEIDLASGYKSTSTLKQPGNPIESRSPADSCDYAGFDTHGTQAGYVICRTVWLGQLLGH